MLRVISCLLLLHFLAAYARESILQSEHAVPKAKVETKQDVFAWFKSIFKGKGKGKSIEILRCFDGAGTLNDDCSFGDVYAAYGTEESHGGALSFASWSRVAQSTIPSEGPTLAKEVFTAFDRDRSGSLNKSEFTWAFAALLLAKKSVSGYGSGALRLGLRVVLLCLNATLTFFDHVPFDVLFWLVVVAISVMIIVVPLSAALPVLYFTHGDTYDYLWKLQRATVERNSINNLLTLDGCLYLLDMLRATPAAGPAKLVANSIVHCRRRAPGSLGIGDDQHVPWFTSDMQQGKRLDIVHFSLMSTVGKLLDQRRFSFVEALQATQRRAVLSSLKTIVLAYFWLLIFVSEIEAFWICAGLTLVALHPLLLPSAETVPYECICIIAALLIARSFCFYYNVYGHMSQLLDWSYGLGEEGKSLSPLLLSQLEFFASGIVLLVQVDVAFSMARAFLDTFSGNLRGSLLGNLWSHFRRYHLVAIAALILDFLPKLHDFQCLFDPLSASEASKIVFSTFTATALLLSLVQVRVYLSLPHLWEHCTAAVYGTIAMTVMSSWDEIVCMWLMRPVAILALQGLELISGPLDKLLASYSLHLPCATLLYPFERLHTLMFHVYGLCFVFPQSSEGATASYASLVCDWCQLATSASSGLLGFAGKIVWIASIRQILLSYGLVAAIFAHFLWTFCTMILPIFWSLIATFIRTSFLVLIDVDIFPAIYLETRLAELDSAYQSDLTLVARILNLYAADWVREGLADHPELELDLKTELLALRKRIDGDFERPTVAPLSRPVP